MLLVDGLNPALKPWQLTLLRGFSQHATCLGSEEPMKLLCDRQRFGARKLFRRVDSTGDQYSRVEDSHLRNVAHQLGDPKGVLQPLGTQSGDACQFGQTRRDKVPNPMNAHGPKPSDGFGAESRNRIDKTLLGQIVSLSMPLMHHRLDALRNLRILLLS